jgi:6-pyruvoyltetrahydropterin/6-carboxytetrahydropterin synthase
MFRVTRRYQFSASHRLHSAQLSEEENQRLYGKCNNPFGHGHNYVLEVSVRGPVDTLSGRAVDPAALDQLVRERVIRAFDHKNLNEEIEMFQRVVPTSENLTVRIQQILSQVPLPAHLEGIRIEETAKNSFEYAGDEPPRR